jgi:hypothetical protein
MAWTARSTLGARLSSPDDPVATERLAHGALRARDDQPDAERLEGVVDGPQRLRAGHVELTDRLEVEDDGVGPRVECANPREEVVLEDVGVGEDQLRLEAMDVDERDRRRVRVVLQVAVARAVATASERGDVRVVDRVDQQDEAEGDADRDAGKDVDQDDAEQGAERSPELVGSVRRSLRTVGVAQTPLVRPAGLRHFRVCLRTSSSAIVSRRS